jgi:hypothetical protein
MPMFNTNAALDYHHLDIRRAERTKVLSVVWKDGGADQVVTVERGAWEQYLLS